MRKAIVMEDSQMPEALRKFWKFAQEVTDAHYFGMGMTRGQTYYRLTVKTQTGTEIVWAFVRISNGLIYRPADWFNPRPKPRGSIHEPTSYLSYGHRGPHKLGRNKVVF